MFDWERDWYEGYSPKKRFEWKETVREHPVEVGASLLLAALLLVWWGVS